MNPAAVDRLPSELAGDAVRSSWTHRDGSKREVYFWPAAGAAGEVALVLVHGFGEHAGRLKEVVDCLAPLGMNAVGYDHVGHGRSDGQRGDAASIDALADDFGQILPYLLERAGAKRAVVFGHSMGALTLARYLTRGGGDGSIVAAILSAPAFIVPKTLLVRIKVAVGKVIARVWPRMSFAAGVDSKGLSRDEKVAWAYERDPLVHGKISARLGRSLIEDGERYADDGGSLTVPILLYHGGSDPIASVEGSRRFAMSCPPQLLTYGEWGGCFHEMHHELLPERQELFDLIVQWMSPKVESRRHP
jgi:alpha-beta hydrolase superfamily lysophospholipase